MTTLVAPRLSKSPISAVDLFCGAGGLTHGLRRAGINVEAGIDLDLAAEHAYVQNNRGARFLGWDVSKTTSPSVAELFDTRKVRLLAGCAPCQPFSKLTNGDDRHRAWDLLRNFARLVKGLRPELVTMENVPELAGRGREIFDEFLAVLQRCGYFVDWKIVNCVEYGAPQLRKRLVLLASLAGPIGVPRGKYTQERWKTVRDAIEDMPSLRDGDVDSNDRVHIAAKLSPTNVREAAARRCQSFGRQP